MFDAHALLSKMHELSMIGKRVNAVVVEFYFTNGSAKMLMRVWAVDQKKVEQSFEPFFCIMHK